MQKLGHRADARHRCVCVVENVWSCMGSSSQVPVLRPPVAEHMQDVRREILVLPIS